MNRLYSVLAAIAFSLAGAWQHQAIAQVSEPPNKESQSEPGADEKTADVGEKQDIPPDEIVRRAFAPPPEAVALTKKKSLWIDRKRKRVYLDGYVAMRRGVLELFACPSGTKEHESIVATLATAREVHAALLAIEATPGTPVRHLPQFVPATGQVIRVWVCWRDDKGQFQVSDARQWIQKQGTKKAMQAEWVFAGSSFWHDPTDGRDYYQADGGDMICVSNFTTAMMDVTISSSAQADQLQFVTFEERIPEIGTPVRLILAPIPNPTDKPAPKPHTDPNQPPGKEVLPKKAMPQQPDAAAEAAKS